jgi:hypothetical protein
MLIQQTIDTKLKLGKTYVVTTWKFLGIPIFIRTVRANIL